MLLFVDLAMFCRSARPRKAELMDGAAALRDALGPYLGYVELVFMGHKDAGATAVLKRAAELAGRVVGSLAEDAPPRALGRYDNIRYWLLRRSAVRVPTWLAVQPHSEGWPADQLYRLIQCAEPLPSPASEKAIRDRLEQYYWPEIWWGEGAPPASARRWQAHGLMVAWSVPRKRWPELLGSTAIEFERRLDLMLAIHAGAQILPSERPRLAHWVHLPSAELGMRRPLEVISSEGLRGIRRVHDYIWQVGAARL